MPLRSEKQKSEDARLAVVVADRLHQLVEALPHQFRGLGKGLEQDLVREFEIPRTLARKILDADGPPPAWLLARIAQRCGVTTDWLLGLNDEPLATVRGERLTIRAWSPAGVEGAPMPSLQLPKSLFPSTLPTGQLLAARCTDHALRPYAGPGDLVLVRVQADILPGARHLVAWRDGRLEAARVTQFGTTGALRLELPDDRVEEVPHAMAAFGPPAPDHPANAREADTLLRILGPIVGRVSVSEHGLADLQQPVR